jgi:regulatory protein
MAGTRARRESFAEKRARRAAVDDPAVVLEAAARFLEARSRSVHEVRRRLGGAGYQTELVEGAITRMTELGMLDDEAFARTWVESRDRARPRGERAIREELRL